MRPKAPKKRPKGAQRVAKRHPREPKSSPRPSKLCPRQAQEAPKPLQKRAWGLPKQSWGTMLLSSFIQKALEAIFCCLWVQVLKSLNSRWRGGEYSFCEVLMHLRKQAKPANELRKKWSWSSQKPRKSSPGPSKIEPGALQDAQKPAKRSNKRSKRRKMRPRSAQERKIVPTWLQHGQEKFSRWPGWPPLGH